MTEVITTQQILLYIFAAVIGSSALTSVINFFFNRSQNKAKEDLDKASKNKIDAEAEQIEVDTEVKIIKYQDEQIEKLIKKIGEFQIELEEYKINYTKALLKLQEVTEELEENKKQMNVVLKMLKAKDKEICKRKDCPNKEV